MISSILTIMSNIKKTLIKKNPVKIIIYGYLSYIIIGSILLTLPISLKSNIDFIDNIFISTSAVSTTGLATVSISDNYSFFGQVIILLLIQMGGLGYMTFSSFIILSSKKKLSDNIENISKTVFSLPSNFKIEKFIVSVISFTVIIELFGSICLFFIFRGKVENPLWSSVFHSISAFCTAGFSLYNNSFESFSDNFYLNFVISFLSYSGGIGFIVFVDLWRKITGKIEKITFTSQIILRMTFYITIFSTFFIFISEGSIQQLEPWKRLTASFFQTMTALTTVGFNTISINMTSKSVLMLLILLMTIGASPSGTGGGMKTTTISAVYSVIKSVFKNKENCYCLGAKIPESRIKTANATFSLYIITINLGLYLLLLTEKFSFSDIMFETISALGTVGLSTGITSLLSPLGKIIIISLMFIGRVGPITFGTAVFVKPQLIYNNEENDLVI